MSHESGVYPSKFVFWDTLFRWSRFVGRGNSILRVQLMYLNHGSPFRSDPSCIPLVVIYLVRKLRRNHAQVRLSAFQVSVELFSRSHAFRELFIGDHFDEVF